MYNAPKIDYLTLISRAAVHYTISSTTQGAPRLHVVVLELGHAFLSHNQTVLLMHAFAAAQDKCGCGKRPRPPNIQS